MKDKFDLNKLKIERKQECHLNRTDRLSLRTCLNEFVWELERWRFWKNIPSQKSCGG